jgi:hypothetical protein
LRVFEKDKEGKEKGCRRITHSWILLWYTVFYPSPSQWSRGLRHESSSPARTLRSWVRIPLKAWMSVCAFILCVSSGLETGWSPVQGVLPIEKGAKVQRAVEPEREREFSIPWCLWVIVLNHPYSIPLRYFGRRPT